MKKIPEELKEYADRVFVARGIPQEETIKRVIEGCKIFKEAMLKSKDEDKQNVTGISIEVE